MHVVQRRAARADRARAGRGDGAMQVGHHDRRHAGGERARARPARNPRARRSPRRRRRARAAASRKMSGAGLPRATSSPPTSAAKRGEQRRCARASLRARSRRVDVATARGIAVALEPVEQLDERRASARCLRARRWRRTRRASAPHQRVDRIAGAVMRAQQRRAVAEVAADHRRAAAPMSKSTPIGARGIAPTRARPAARCRASGRPCRRSRRAGGERARRASSRRTRPPRIAVARAAQRRRRRAPPCAWQIAQASASAASGDGAPGKRSSRRTISCTCGFGARAVADDRLLHLQRRVFGTGSPASTAAAIAAPRAWPSSSVELRIDVDEHLLDRDFGRAAARRSRAPGRGR